MNTPHTAPAPGTVIRQQNGRVIELQVADGVANFGETAFVFRDGAVVVAGRVESMSPGWVAIREGDTGTGRVDEWPARDVRVQPW